METKKPVGMPYLARCSISSNLMSSYTKDTFPIFA